MRSLEINRDPSPVYGMMRPALRVVFFSDSQTFARKQQMPDGRLPAKCRREEKRPVILFGQVDTDVIRMSLYSKPLVALLQHVSTEKPRKAPRFSVAHL
jgi:hypothetical protein